MDMSSASLATVLNMKITRMVVVFPPGETGKGIVEELEKWAHLGCATSRVAIEEQSEAV